MTIPFYLYNSFTQTPFAGNPAGVFLDADGLDPAQMLRMAAEAKVESAFVSGGADNTFMRYFTPTAEVPLCGHATVAAATAMALSGRLAVPGEYGFTCPAGRLRFRLSAEGGRTVVHLTQTAPVFGPCAAADDVQGIAAALNAQPGSLHPVLPVQVVSTGSPWMFVPVARRETVDAAPGDMALIAGLAEKYGALGMYVFALNTEAAGKPLAYSRCFAPSVGLNEDPATGSASGALGCYLAQHGIVQAGDGGFWTEQGTAIGRTGRVFISTEFATDGRPAGVTIGGVATLIAQGTMVVP